MSEPIIEYREEFNVADIARKYAERVARVIDEQTLANVENQLAEFGYVKVVRCRDCVHCYEDRRNTAIGWVDIFVCDSKQWSTSSLMPSHTIEPDGFCKWGERREGAES